MKTIIDVQNLSVLHSRENKQILEDINLTIDESKIIGLIGESGSGKTVLAHAIINWINPPLEINSGKLLYKGNDLRQFSRKETSKIVGKEISYIGSNPVSSFDPTLAVGSQIMEKLIAVVPNISKKEAKQIIIEFFKTVQIPSASKRFNEYPFQYSGGMMQRAIIVDSLVSNPTLLVADNITQALDVTIAAQILRLLRDLKSKYKTSIIFISSLLGIVEKIADQILVLKDGTIVENTSTKSLISNPQHLYTKELIKTVPKVWGKTIQPTKVYQTSDIILEVKDVHKTYIVSEKAFFKNRYVKAVRGVSFKIARFENFGIIGESGCGKSTLSRLLSYLEKPDSGEIRFNKQNLLNLNKKKIFNLRKKFQLLLQDPYNSISNHSTIGNTIAEPLVIHKQISKSKIKEKVIEVMKEVGLDEELFNNLPSGLSAGQRQRINIARALVLEPELLILDETLSSLDQIEQAKLLQLFERLKQRYEITFIFISHDLTMVRKVCDRIAVMYLGKIVELTINNKLYEKPAHPYKRALLSSVPNIGNNPYSTSKYLLEGEPPDPSNIPKGCDFMSRCPFSFDKCGDVDPDLYQRSDDQLSACHLKYSELPSINILEQAAK